MAPAGLPRRASAFAGWWWLLGLSGLSGCADVAEELDLTVSSTAREAPITCGGPYRELVRIVSGIHRRRQLVSPDHDGIRPTSDRVRESVFNSLGSLGLVDDIRVLDLFAGTGALGLEALSRGAGHVVFVERDRDALVALRGNIELLDEEDRSTVIAGAAETFLASTADHFDVALLDPPYRYEGWDEVLANVPADVLVIESDREIEVPAGWESLRVKQYAGTVVTIVRRTAAAV